MTHTSLADLAWPRHTARLELRLAEAGDVPELWSWMQLPEVTEWLSFRPPDQAAFAERFLRNLGATLVARRDGRIVAYGKVDRQDGWAQSDVLARAAGTLVEVGWVLDPSVHGQGLGTELARDLLAIAFDELGVRRVVAVCFAANVASWKIMEKLGMRREAHNVADSLHRNGQWLDGLWYAMLADEWRDRRPDVKQLTVVGAVIEQDGRILAARRGSGPLAGLWEFPGGKVEPGETAQEALVREISEELACEIAVGPELTTATHAYDFATVTMTTYRCLLIAGTPTPLEHAELRWLAPSELGGVAWASVDQPTVDLLATQPPA